MSYYEYDLKGQVVTHYRDRSDKVPCGREHGFSVYYVLSLVNCPACKDSFEYNCALLAAQDAL